MVGVELGVCKSLPSLSLPGTVDGGVLRSSDKLSADPRALPDELSRFFFVLKNNNDQDEVDDETKNSTTTTQGKRKNKIEKF